MSNAITLNEKQRQFIEFKQKGLTLFQVYHQMPSGRVIRIGSVAGKGEVEARNKWEDLRKIHNLPAGHLFTVGRL